MCRAERKRRRLEIVGVFGVGEGRVYPLLYTNVPRSLTYPLRFCRSP